jgi:sec-independent protein translocase protein TatC
VSESSVQSAGRSGRMSLSAHLIELRKRLYIIAVVVNVGAVAGWFLTDPVLAAMRQPIYAVALSQHRVATLNYDGITSAFDLKLQIAFTISLVITSPLWLYQIFAYFMPAMTRREMKYTVGFLVAAIPLFIVGCIAGWLVFPHIVELMTSFAPQADSTIITSKSYFDFVLKLVIVVGVAFVLPVFLVLLNFAGVISAKSILKSWRWAILVITLFTAIATPAADVVSMLLLAAPMVGLYFLAAAIASIHDARKAKRAGKADNSPFAPVPVSDLLSEQ